MTAEPPTPEQVLISFLKTSRARCPRCRYDLTNGESNRCPECGSELHLTLASGEGLSTLWYAGVFGAGLTLVLAVTLLLRVMRRIWAVFEDPSVFALVRGGFVSQQELPNWTSATGATICCLASALMLAWLIAWRRRYATLPPVIRYGLGVGAMIMPLALLGLIGLCIALSS